MESEDDILAQKIWDYHHINHNLKQADCILGLGSYDLRVAERCADLFLEKYAPFIIFTGGLGNWTKDKWDRSEAEIFKQHIILHKDVPNDAIKTESESTNISENITFTKNMLSERGIQPKSLILVTKPNTTRRAYATFKKNWPTVDVMVTSPLLQFQNQPGIYVTKYNLINEMVGDLQRIKIYSGLGYQIPQQIPEEVWIAYERLVVLKYDEHLIKASV